MGFILIFWSLMLVALATNSTGQQTVINHQKKTIGLPVQYTSPSPALPGQSFDKNLGNNYISAKYATQFMDYANKLAPGATQNVYLELSPADPAGKTEESYKKSISNSFLTVTVNSTYWNIPDDSTKKNLITKALNELKKIFSGYPHITITDGTKILATGEIPSPDGAPKVILK